MFSVEQYEHNGRLLVNKYSDYSKSIARNCEGTGTVYGVLIVRILCKNKMFEVLEQ